MGILCSIQLKAALNLLTTSPNFGKIRGTEVLVEDLQITPKSGVFWNLLQNYR
jgi:hypothetical protein